MKKNTIHMLLASLCLGGFAISCTKSIDYGTDPYGTSEHAFDLKFADAAPSPSQARPGEEVTYKLVGLSGIDKTAMTFFVNNNPSEIIAATDSTITVRLPETVSTGSARLVINGQTFAGPLTPIIGKVAIDPIFNAGTGASGILHTIKRLNNGQFFLGGNFDDYNGSKALSEINGIARITATGEFVSGMAFGEGAKGGTINNIVELPDGRLFVAGNFSQYDTDKTVRSMSILNVSGSLNKESVEILNLTDDPTKGTLNVPVFNGGVLDGGIVKAFYRDNKMTVVGGFKRYTSNYYARSTYNQILSDYFQSASIARVNLDGSLDSTFLVDNSSFPKRGSYGVNGGVFDATMDDKGTLTMVGSFTQYNNKISASRILRLKTSGELDTDFNAGVGADNTIYKIVPVGNKFYLIGSFLNYKGQQTNNIVLINADGSVDPSFKAKSFTGGIPDYLAVLDNGLLLVSGTFKRYDNVIREGLMILNSDGSLAKGYNNTGRFLGSVTDSYIGVNSIGQRTITLVGLILSFNGKSDLGNIVRLTIQD